MCLGRVHRCERTSRPERAKASNGRARQRWPVDNVIEQEMTFIQRCPYRETNRTVPYCQQFESLWIGLCRGLDLGLCSLRFLISVN